MPNGVHELVGTGTGQAAQQPGLVALHGSQEGDVPAALGQLGLDAELVVELRFVLRHDDACQSAGGDDNVKWRDHDLTRQGNALV